MQNWYYLSNFLNNEVIFFIGFNHRLWFQSILRLVELLLDLAFFLFIKKKIIGKFELATVIVVVYVLKLIWHFHLNFTDGFCKIFDVKEQFWKTKRNDGNWRRNSLNFFFLKICWYESFHVLIYSFRYCLWLYAICFNP